MTELISYHSLLKRLNAETTVLTPNRRLSAKLHQLYQANQLERGESCWQTPEILPIASWLQRLWQAHCTKQLTPSPHLLTVTQELFLWEKIIADDDEQSVLLQLSETAKMARSATGLLTQWQIETNDPLFSTAEDYRALHGWKNKFNSICDSEHYCDATTLTNRIITLIQNKKIKLAKQILLIGFTELSPQIKSLLLACKNVGCNVSELRIAQQNSQCYRTNFADAETEIVAIARWAKATYARHPSDIIGCVFPALDKMRDRVVQIFSEVFAEHDNYHADPKSRPFNISAGKSLLKYEIIHTALQLLTLNKKTISLELVSNLLTSPFIGDAEIERTKRANFDSSLRRSNKHSIHLPSLLNEEKRLSINETCPLLSNRLREFLQLAQEKKMATLTFAEWAFTFNQLLSALGWPGERSLNSEEYQVVESWLKLLTEFTTLDHVSGPVNYSQALSILQKLAANTQFQAQTPDAPIQVLGILEAASYPFDHLWIAGMDDLTWPPQPKPNPFIPKQIQRELQMPHATAERELIFCRDLIEQFKNGATQVYFSHAVQHDEAEVQASPLIRDLTEISFDTLDIIPYQSPIERIFNARKIEKIIDDQAPTFQGVDIPGGVSAIRNQALCPFKAFAEFRLHARELESPLPGMRAKERGTIVHKVFEMIWDEIKDHTSLIMMQDEVLQNLILHNIDKAMMLLCDINHENHHYFELEKIRLAKLATNWLQIEKSRAPFKVLSSEKVAQIKLGTLNLNVRIDRIDELENGKKLMIDYKTGKNNDINRWFDDRPEEPQLPIYALLDKQNTAGISFAQLFPGQHCFKGLSHEPLNIKGITTVPECDKSTALSWDEQITQWQHIFDQLSHAFYSGVATVDPKDPPETCNYCALKPLCRINDNDA